MAPLMATALGFILLTANSILAIHRSWGDAAATIFVIASYASLVLLFYFLRLFETAPPGSPAATKLGFGALILNSALAIYNSWDDAGSVAFVLVAVAALLLLVLRLREFEMATVWALTTLLTAMFAWRVAPIMPLAVGVLVFLCKKQSVQPRSNPGRVPPSPCLLVPASTSSAQDCRRNVCSEGLRGTQGPDKLIEENQAPRW